MGFVIGCNGMDGNAHLVNCQVGRKVIVSSGDRVETVGEGLSSCSGDRSELMKPLESSDSVGSG